MNRKAGFFSSLFLLFIILCSIAPYSNHPTLLRLPYLQMAFADSVTILWRTDLGSYCKVAYKSATDSVWMETAGTCSMTNTGVTENEVVLKGLLPNTRYQYRVLTNNKELLAGKELWFRSSKTKADSVFQFFAVGDIGEPIETGGTPDQLAASIVPFVDSLDFGLLLGDIIYPDGQSKLYDKNLFQYFGNVFPYVPVYPILGNHDWHAPEDNYMHEWKLPNNEHWYSFDYGNVHFIGLDSKFGDFHQYGRQKRWLRRDLRNVSDSVDWVIVFVHHNGKSCTYKEDYSRVVSLYSIFEAYGVDLVLNGHAHTYERLNPMNGEGEVLEEYLINKKAYTNPEGFISITVGSGGKLRGVGSDPKPFTPDPENCRHPNLVAAAEHQWAYLQLSVNGKEIRGRAIATEDLEVVDEFVISKN